MNKFESLKIKYGKTYIEESKQEALKNMENIPLEDELDKKQQELILRGINEQLENGNIIDIKVLQREFIEANYIKDDTNLIRTKKEFKNIITFFVANGLLETISLEAIKMRVNEEQFNRMYKKVESKTYTIGSRK